MKENNYEKAYYYLTENIKITDSLSNEQSQRAAIRQQIQYDYDKQQALEKERHLHELEVAEERESRQRLITYGVGIGLAMVLFFSFLLFKRLKVTRRQKQIIEQQKLVVEEKNNEITDSISYAKRIQEAILPPPGIMQKKLPNSFVLYLPKDIVAGDFYWMEAVGDTTIFAAADCTGHGVPGAMVSVVCNNALNRAVREYKLTDPGKILDKVNELVEETFSQSSHRVKDGMDVALCTLKNNQLKYAGANNPLWLFKKGITKLEEVEEIKADKQPIGSHSNRKPYTTHTIQLQEGDTFYIFSDGFADQFGGPKAKKLKYKPFRQLLLDVAGKPMSKQKLDLETAFHDWKGDLEQVDDVCIIGIQV